MAKMRWRWSFLLGKAVCRSWQSLWNERSPVIFGFELPESFCATVRLPVNGQKLCSCVRSGKLQITEEVWFSFQLASARTLEQFVDIFNSATRHARKGASKEETSTESLNWTHSLAPHRTAPHLSLPQLTTSPHRAAVHRFGNKRKTRATFNVAYYWECAVCVCVPESVLCVCLGVFWRACLAV